MPIEPITTVPVSAFLGMTACAVVLNIIAVLCYIMASKYKKQLKNHLNQSLGNPTISKTNTNNSSNTTTMASSQSKGKERF